MNSHVISDGKTVYTRISKQLARKRFDVDLAVVFCPVKLRPGFPFAPHVLINNSAEYRESSYTFDVTVRNFEYYNCNCSETGSYTAFYVTQETVAL